LGLISSLFLKHIFQILAKRKKGHLQNPWSKSGNRGNQSNDPTPQNAAAWFSFKITKNV